MSGPVRKETVRQLCHAVVATNGRIGYADASRLGPDAWPQPANPAQALAWQDTPLVTVHITVYLADGKTRIGVFDEPTPEAYLHAPNSKQPVAAPATEAPSEHRGQPSSRAHSGSPLRMFADLGGAGALAPGGRADARESGAAGRPASRRVHAR